jgi:hypothetical protein
MTNKKPPQQIHDESLIVDRLEHALSDTQDTIRAFDVKAEILAAVLALTVGLVNYGVLSSIGSSSTQKLLVSISLCGGLITVIILGAVLWPMSNPVDGLDIIDCPPKGTYFVTTKTQPEFLRLACFLVAARETNWVEELGLELVKCSRIRDRKAAWFKKALVSAFMTVLLTGGVVVYVGISSC